MSSIRLRLALGAVLLSALGIGVLLASNIFLMEPYYAMRSRGEFEAIADRLRSSPAPSALAPLPAPSSSPAGEGRAPPPGQAGPADRGGSLGELQALAAGTGYKIVLADREGMVLASSAPEFRGGSAFPLPKEQRESLLARRAALEGGERFFGVLEADGGGQSVLQLLAFRSGGDFIVITQPLDQLRSGIAAARPFFLVTGCVVLLLELALFLALSGLVTRPILELSAVARRVAAGDYAARAPRGRKDEIGLLGESLDAMAAALARNIAELTEANRELALKVRAQEEFIAGASHELKTPVGLVRGYAEAIQLGLYASEAERNELAEVILKEADHLDRLVRDLAQLSALTEGGHALLPEPADLRELAQAAVGRFSRAEAARDRLILLEGEATPPTVFDPDRLLQVLDNYLSNALRHTPPGGTVTVRTAMEEDGILLEVENEGDRLAEEQLARLFRPFHRVDAARSRRLGGTGLGLAIVRGIALAHGGSCGARNTATGVLFWLRLPIQAG